MPSATLASVFTSELWRIRATFIFTNPTQKYIHMKSSVSFRAKSLVFKGLLLLQLNTLWVTRCMQLYIDKRISQAETITCIAV